MQDFHLNPLVFHYNFNLKLQLVFFGWSFKCIIPSSVAKSDQKSYLRWKDITLTVQYVGIGDMLNSYSQHRGGSISPE